MKKGVKIFCTILAIILLLGIGFFIIDSSRVSKQLKPIFCIKNPAGTMNDGGTIEYFGLGYKVIDFHTLAGFDDIKIGTWFMDYNDFSSEMKQYEESLSNIENDTMLIREPRSKEYTFYGRVIEANAKYIIVEPNEGEEIIKSADKISIGLGEDNDVLYVVGTNVKVTYDGSIQETYPAQINATKIEIRSAEDFEILFYDKQPMENHKIYKILDKSETDKYDYNIYGYAGSVNIRIDGKDYSLKDALLENKITMEEIIAKANQDEKNGIIKSEMYKDGGSIEYHYENYTIIKCHTVDGNRDVYIGNKDLTLNDVI